VSIGSRLLPAALVVAAFAAGTVDLSGLALWLGLLAVPAAASTAFVAVSDTLEGRPTLLRAVTSGVALALLVVACAARSNAVAGAGTPPLATWGLLLALLSYSAPVVVWMLEPVKVTRTRPERRRRRPVEVEPFEVFERAA
jgi:hypothetical protein